MNPRDIIRTAVLKTNPYWPFSHLNKIPYHLAIESFLQQCNELPAIKSVYLRHSLAEGDWIPGLSDIDFSVIIDSNLTAIEELLFLNSFWRKYSKVKKLFPMLGEVEILSETDLKDLGSEENGVWGYSQWKLMYGRDFQKLYRNPNVTERNTRYLALGFYYIYFIKKFFSPHTPKDILIEELERISRKIIRFADCRYTEKHQKTPQTIFDVFYYIVEKLDEGTDNKLQFDIKNTSTMTMKENTNLKVSFEHTLPIDNRYKDFLEKLPLFIKRLLNTNKQQVCSILFLHYIGNIYIVIKDNLSKEEFKKLLMKIRNTVLHFDITPPLIGTLKMLKETVESTNPCWYYSLVNKGEVLYGADVIKALECPSRSALVNFMLRNAAWSSKDLRRHGYGNNRCLSYTSWLAKPEVYYLLEKLMRNKLFFEKGSLVTSPAQLSEELNKYYPELYQTSERLKKKWDIDEAVIAEAKFILMRKLSEEAKIECRKFLL